MYQRLHNWVKTHSGKFIHSLWSCQERRKKKKSRKKCLKEKEKEPKFTTLKSMSRSLQKLSVKLILFFPNLHLRFISFRRWSQKGWLLSRETISCSSAMEWRTIWLKERSSISVLTVSRQSRKCRWSNNLRFQWETTLAWSSKTIGYTTSILAMSCTWASCHQMSYHHSWPRLKWIKLQYLDPLIFRRMERTRTLSKHLMNCARTPC